MYVERFSRYDLDKFGKKVVFRSDQHIKTIITLVLLGAESWLIALFKDAALKHVVHIVTHHETNKKVLAFCKL